jgi:VWFA-related protein
MLRALAALSLTSLALAQQPTFRAGARLVQVDVVVVHNKNGAVAGLQKSDFTILDEGKPQPITVFAVTTASRQSGEAFAPLPAGSVSNQRNRKGEPLSTATILLIDRLNTPVNDQFYANQKIIKFLQSRGAGDRLGIYVLGNGIRVVQELTDDPDRLDRAVKTLKPQDARRFSADNITADASGDAVTDAMIADSISRMQQFAVDDRVRAVREAMLAIARHLAKVPGRKNLIWVSGSFPLIIVKPHEVIDYSKDVDAAARALNDANVAVYPVDARGLIGTPAGNAETGPSGRPNCYTQGICVGADMLGGGPTGLDTMNTLAGLTGGLAFYNTNGIEDSIRKATDDAEITYTLGFAPTDDSFDDKFHKLLVKVNRKGVDVRFRKGYFALKPPPEPSSQETVAQLLRSPLDATAVGITADAKRNRDQPGRLDARIIIDIRSLQLEHKDGVASGAVDISLYAEGAKSVFALTRRFEIPDSQFAAVLQSGVEIPASLDSASEARDLHIVVQDKATGAAGSVRVALEGK